MSNPARWSDLNVQDAVLTAHVLDAELGCPVDNVELRLKRRIGGEYQPVLETRTNSEGRFVRPLLSGDVQAGHYRLEWDIGAYLGEKRRGILSLVVVDVHITNPETHYHVALVLSANGYFVYRGAPPKRAPKGEAPLFTPKANQRSNATNSDHSQPSRGAHGLTTHVIDIARGCGAEGLPVECVRIGPERERLALLNVNAEGRTDRWLVADGHLKRGTYELKLALADYYSSVAKWPDDPFFPTVCVRIGVDETHAHYHVPILVTPYGYSVYRGS